MPGRQSVRVTYAHKKRRIQSASKKLLSSPLEVLPPEMDDITRTQMASRMLKRSRRVALAERSEDKNVERIREHLAKKIRYNRERVSNLESVGVPFGAGLQDDITFQTPFSSPHTVHESAIAKLSIPEQLSPVPATRRIVSCTSSRNLKENNTRTLASPFSSRPGSAASSPRHKGRGRSARRLVRSTLHTKSRTLSGVFRENFRWVSRNNSTVSLQDVNREPHARFVKHRRYPSSPSTPYMRSQFAQEDWVVPLKVFSCTFDAHDDAVASSSGAVHSDGSFYTDQPQFCSTPAMSRLRRTPDLGSFLDPTEAGSCDVEMMDNTMPPRRQAIHLSGNSIFSSSDEFTIESLSAKKNSATMVEDEVFGRDKPPARAARPISARFEEAGSQASHYSTGSFVAEYDIPLVDMGYSPVPTTATTALGLEDAYKLSVGEQMCHFPGTSPAHGGTLVIRTRRKPATLTPPASPCPMALPCPPSSPASDLTQEFESMNVSGDLDTHSDGETHRSFAPILLARAHSLHGAPAELTTKKSIKRMPARNRAGTVRASDFVRSGPSTSSSGGAPGPTVSLLSHVRRTRSGTVVGPDSRFATKGSSAEGAPATGLRAVQSVSEMQSDDELLLKVAWMEDVEYLGLGVSVDEDAEADELNLGGPPRRLGLRRQ